MVFRFAVICAVVKIDPDVDFLAGSQVFVRDINTRAVSQHSFAGAVLLIAEMYFIRLRQCRTVYNESLPVIILVQAPGHGIAVFLQVYSYFVIFHVFSLLLRFLSVYTPYVSGMKEQSHGSSGKLWMTGLRSTRMIGFSLSTLSQS